VDLNATLTMVLLFIYLYEKFEKQRNHIKRRCHSSYIKGEENYMIVLLIDQQGKVKKMYFKIK
jgi:flagellar biogenesis protein FliO